MWDYKKNLIYPVNIKNKNPKLAKIILAQYGGPDGELGASLRYLSQRFTMPDSITKGLLTDIGTEEMAHLEVVGSIIYQLTRDLNDECVKNSGFDDYFINHTTGIYPANTNGTPFTAAYIAISGDPIADLTEDLAAEQKARATYDNILRLSDDPDVNDAIKFLREREIVHYQRFGELQRPTLNEIIRYTATLESLSFFISYIGVAKNVNILPTLILKNEKQIYQIHFSL